MTTYTVSPAYIVSHIFTNKDLEKDFFIENEVKWLKRFGLDKYLKMNAISKDKLCKYFTYITSSLKPVTNLRLSS